jgi:hypothetical protein
MARGWESKSVESQMESANDTVAGRQARIDSEKKTEREVQGLQLSRAYILKQMESATNERYKESLQQALKDLDRKIAKLEGK